MIHVVLKSVNQCLLINSLYRAKADYDNNTTIAYKFDDFCSALDKKHVILAPFCGDIPCEEKVKKLSARYLNMTVFKSSVRDQIQIFCLKFVSSNTFKFSQAYDMYIFFYQIKYVV